jgi:hypothetical protein
MLDIAVHICNPSYLGGSKFEASSGKKLTSARGSRGGYKERVREAEYNGNTMYSCTKMEK